MLGEGAHECYIWTFGMFPPIWTNLGLEGALHIVRKAAEVMVAVREGEMEARHTETFTFGAWNGGDVEERRRSCLPIFLSPLPTKVSGSKGTSLQLCSKPLPRLLKWVLGRF